jgi:hypothetical protein
MGAMRNAHIILVGKAEGKRQLARPKYSWEEGIKMDIKQDMAIWAGYTSV